jgi:N-methylhydantoinase A
LAAAYAELSRRVVAVLAQEGVTTPELSAGLDLRYRGQSYELTVPLDSPITPAGIVVAVDAFHAAHAQRYGYAMTAAAVECVTLRVVGRAPGARPLLPSAPLGGPDAAAAQVGVCRVWFAADGATVTPVYDRSPLAPGQRFVGPALVRQYDATIVIHPGWSAWVDRLGNLWLERENTP